MDVQQDVEPPPCSDHNTPMCSSNLTSREKQCRLCGGKIDKCHDMPMLECRLKSL